MGIKDRGRPHVVGAQNGLFSELQEVLGEEGAEQVLGCVGQAQGARGAPFAGAGKPLEWKLGGQGKLS